MAYAVGRPIASRYYSPAVAARRPCGLGIFSSSPFRPLRSSINNNISPDSGNRKAFAQEVLAVLLQPGVQYSAQPVTRMKEASDAV